MMALIPAAAAAQTCTTQAKMAADVRTSLADQAMALALEVKANDGSRVQADAAPVLAASFTQTAFLLRTTSENLAADSMKVTQLYLLDASKRAAGDAAPAEFSCPLSGTASETDFTFATLPPGTYAFAMVEATGPKPWLLSFLLQQDGTLWRLAGLYTHTRLAAGRDGLSYWTAAREAVAAKQAWKAWLLFSEAAALLTPAPFVDSTHLDKLLTEQREAAPPELSDGLSEKTPLVLKDAKGDAIALTAVTPEPTDDGAALRLVLHYHAQPGMNTGAARDRNVDAARTFFQQHKELRSMFSAVFVVADTDGQPPFPTNVAMADIP